MAESAVREAEDRLKEVMNIPETLGTWLIRIRPTDSPPFMALTAISLDAQIDAALKNRPDVVQSQLDIASRQIDRDVARNQRLPQLDLEARVGVRAFGDKVDESLAQPR